jgi:hypothetical protein
VKRLALLILLCVMPAAAGQSDLSTPKAAARSLFNAINTGNRDAVAAALYSADDAQAEYARALADMIVAGKHLGDVAQKQFGAAGAAIGAGTLDPAAGAKLDEATVEQSRDQAKIVVPGQERPMSFRRNKNGQWGLVIYDAAAAPTMEMGKQTKLVRMLAEAIDASAAEISTGTFKTAEAATTAVQQRLHGVMLSFHRPTTKRSTTAATSTAPTTAPTTSPG